MNVQAMAEELAQRLVYLSSLESLFVTNGEGGFEYWVVGNNISEDEEYCLYDAKWTLLSANPELAIDLHLVDRRGQPLTELLNLERLDGTVNLTDLR
ncbi:MAG TPA: hypothetical protein VF707_12120 [Ardenticatenaceae bacterium]